MKKEIPLTFNRSDFEEIFFRDGNEKLFLHANAKRSFLITLSIAATVLVFILKGYAKNEYSPMILYVSIALLVACIDLYLKLKPLLNWRRGIRAYLDRESAKEQHRIVLTGQTFSVIQDTTETIEAWNTIESAEINDLFIRLVASHTYLIPAKSVAAEDYALLRQTISEKVKQSV